MSCVPDLLYFLFPRVNLDFLAVLGRASFISTKSFWKTLFWSNPYALDFFNLVLKRILRCLIKFIVALFVETEKSQARFVALLVAKSRY